MVRKLSAISALLLAGCATSQVTGYRDPEFRQYNKVAVQAFGMSAQMAAAVETETCRAVAPTVCQRASVILPPTRQWTPEQGKAGMLAAGVEAVILINGAADQSQSGVAGTTYLPGSSTTTGNVQGFGNAAYYNQTTTTNPGVALPIYYANRVTQSQVLMVDVAGDRNVYIGEVATTANGVGNTGDGTFAKSAAQKLAKELRANGLIL